MTILPVDPSDEELARDWTLSAEDLAAVDQRRGDDKRHSFALQLCMLRRYGRFLGDDYSAVPVLPANVREVRRVLETHLPRIRIEDLLVEVDGWCGFTREFAPVGGYAPRLENPYPTLLAALVAHGTNLGIATMAQSTKGISVDMLQHASRWFLRPETLKAANRVLIDHHHRLDLASVWGDSTTSSSDGQRFGVLSCLFPLPLFSSPESPTRVATALAAAHPLREPHVPRRLLALRTGPRPNAHMSRQREALSRPLRVRYLSPRESNAGCGRNGSRPAVAMASAVAAAARGQRLGCTGMTLVPKWPLGVGPS